LRGDDEQLAEARELSDDVLGQAAGQALLLGVAREVLKRQHRDRRLVGQGSAALASAEPLPGYAPGYHYVFLDGPPALVTDARAAASLADTVLYAVLWNKTKAEVASHGLEALAGNRIPVAGLVLTQINLARRARYSYGNVASYYGEYKKCSVD
jgi:Mrp family chromosome partitioning ATPase